MWPWFVHQQGLFLAVKCKAYLLSMASMVHMHGLWRPLNKGQMLVWGLRSCTLCFFLSLSLRNVCSLRMSMCWRLSHENIEHMHIFGLHWFSDTYVNRDIFYDFLCKTEIISRMDLWGLYIIFAHSWLFIKKAYIYFLCYHQAICKSTIDSMKLLFGVLKAFR